MYLTHPCVFKLKDETWYGAPVALLILWIINSANGVETLNKIRNNQMYFEPPKGMHRRFMWKDMDDTVDELMGGVVYSARKMTQMIGAAISPTDKYSHLQGGHYHLNHLDFLSQPSTRVKYIIKKPANKNIKIITIRAPKLFHSLPNQLHNTIVRNKVHYPSEDQLRKLEKQQEMIVEGSLFTNNNHRDPHTNLIVDSPGDGMVNANTPQLEKDFIPLSEIVEYSDLPSTNKPFPVSQLHTNIVQEDSQFQYPASNQDEHSYEVTENAAEESIDSPQTETFHLLPTATVPFTTTEEPNYPKYFLRKFKNSAENQSPLRKNSTEVAVSLGSEISSSGKSLIKTSNNTLEIYKRYPTSYNPHKSAFSPLNRTISHEMLASLNPRPFVLKNSDRSNHLEHKLLTKKLKAERQVLPHNSKRGSIKFGDKLIND